MTTIIDVSGCPDIAPALAVYAAVAKGKTTLINAERLRKKESDRLAAISTNLQSLRVHVVEKKSEITIVFTVWNTLSPKVSLVFIAIFLVVFAFFLTVGKPLTFNAPAI